MKNYRDDILCHYGIKGQKHGHRRFQNEDGSLTAAGRARYLEGNKSAGMSGVVGGTAKAVSGMYANAKNAISKTADEANRRRMASSGPSSASRVSRDITDARLGRRTISRRNDDGSHTSEMRYRDKEAERQGEGFVSTRTNKDGSYQNTYSVGAGEFERYDSKTGRSSYVSPERHDVIRNGNHISERADADRRAGISYAMARTIEDEARAQRAETEKWRRGLATTGADRRAGTSYGAARREEDARRKQGTEAAAYRQKHQTETRRAQERSAGIGMNAAMAQSKEKEKDQELIRRLNNARWEARWDEQGGTRRLASIYSRDADRKAGTSYGAARNAENARRKQEAQEQQNASRRDADRKAGMGMNAAMAQSKAKQAAQAAVNASRSKPASSLGTALNNLKRKLDTAAAQKKADDEKKKRQRSGRRGSYYGG